MTLIASLAGALLVAGILALIYALIPQPVAPPRPKTKRPTLRSTDKTLALAGVAVGGLLALLTGWLVAIILVPAITVMGYRAWSGRRHNRVQRLSALSDFSRGLAGVLTAGRGLEQAIVHAARSAPTALAPEIGRLAARVRANWPTGKALRRFADELDDATGDLFVATLILAAQRRGPGVASAMQALAESIDADVRARRQVETEQQKAKTAARIITIISVVLLIALFTAGSYVDPYRTPLGQLLLTGFMALFLLALAWMGRIARPQPLPRFMGHNVASKAVTR
ncbi:MAG: type II secretion system F family protein [Tessaracoccus sp.]|uniref:type II secretion system F family protein n=1 Tax=Tessaracoccus sp. TaxID=1971211 RepID=UPI001EC2CDEC|nr:type II secretion system F family protein [Tessaracoccus sp.]MBK7822057.1 type II secretion system F family protein [Tessaracoccus sp.]